MARWSVDRAAWGSGVGPYRSDRSPVSSVARAAGVGLVAVVAAVVVWHLLGFLFGAVMFFVHLVVVVAVLAAVGMLVRRIL